MKKFILLFLTLSLILSASLVQAKKVFLPIFITYTDAMSKVYDIYKDNLEAEGYSIESEFQNPVGLSFQPYIQLNNGFRIGAGIGPLMYINTTESDFFAAPINAHIGYCFFPDSNVSPYVKLGLCDPVASGTHVKDTKAGVLAGAGIEFLRGKIISFGFEVAYAASKVTIEKEKRVYTSTSYYGYTYRVVTETEDIELPGLTIGAYVSF
jgi:hypothetical protein